MFKTILAQEAHDNILRFESLVYKRDFKRLTDAILRFDDHLNGFSFHSIEAKEKLMVIKDLSEEEFIQILSSNFKPYLKLDL